MDYNTEGVLRQVTGEYLVIKGRRLERSGRRGASQC
jgi:hypothetical protein